jgi:hypothetical protein
MTTQEIAQKLADYCRKGEFTEAQKALYHQDIVSIEPFATPDFDKETKGFENNIAKSQKFDAMVEAVHKLDVSDPIVSGNSFAFTLSMDLTMKGRGRMTLQELCVYQVKDEKVILEQFFM